MNRNAFISFIAAAIVLTSATVLATAPGPNGKILIQVGVATGASIGYVDPVTGTFTAITPPTPCRFNYEDPAGTADGRIAVVRQDYFCQSGTTTQLLILDAAGNLVKNLGNGVNNGNVAHPAWSPDGTRIAFEDHKPTGESSISVIHADGTGLATILPIPPASPGFFQPTWSPDGTKIAVNQSGHISITNANGTCCVSPLTGGFNDSSPTWSPDGTQIAFFDLGSLFKININGTGLTSLPASNGDQRSRASWSPDGTMIAAGPLGSGGISLINADGSGVRQLTTDDGQLNPDWSSWLPTPLPSLRINDVSLLEGNSGTTPFTFTVTLSAPSTQTVTVDYATADGTALAAADFDYVATSGTLTFIPGVTTQTITVLVNGDTLNEADETFFVNLRNATNATIAHSPGVGTILNDDPLPSLSIDAQTLVTQGNEVFVSVRLSPESGQTVTVNYTTADGTATVADPDYLSRSGTLTFNPRVGRLSGDTLLEIRIPTIGDPVNAPPETFFINLTNPVNATIARGQGVVTIYNIHGNTSQTPGPDVVPLIDSTTGTPVTVTLNSVFEPGDTTLTTNSSCPPAPANFQLGNPPVCYDLKTTALFQGNVKVCINYSGINFTGPPQLFHFESGMSCAPLPSPCWKDVTSSVDTVNKIVCGVVTSLSPFALFEPNLPPIAHCKSVTKSAGASCNATVTAAEVNDGSFDPDGDPITFSLGPAGPFPLGTTPVVLNVTDNKGASSQCSAIIQVVDTTPPMLSCPPDIAVSNSPGSCSANVMITPATAVDNCSAPTVSGARSDGQPLAAVYPVGTTMITWTTTDAAGNRNSCLQKIIVKDTEAPKLNIPSPITTEFTDENGAAVSFAVTSSDNCPGVMQSCTTTSGAVYPIATTPVQCTAVDAHSNSTTKSFTITVLGALGVKQDVLAELQALQSTELDHAIDDLQRSLDPANWIDQTHVTKARVFQDEKDSVNQLTNVITKHGGDPVLQGFVNRIVKSDRLLCTFAINESPNNAEAMRLRAKGDQMAANGQYESAIEQYRNSWSKAVGSH
jgi:Tol biopolymer transport system component